jgi:hypothetical protein
MRIIKHNEFVPNREYLLNIFMKTDDDTKDARMYATYLGKRNLNRSMGMVYFFMVRPVKTPMEDAEFEKIQEFEDIDNNSIKNTNQPQLIAVGEDKIFDGDVFNRKTALREEDEIFGVFYESNKELRDKLKRKISKTLNKMLPGDVTQNIIDYLPKNGGGKKTRRKK